jgi:hypothetical protein
VDFVSFTFVADVVESVDGIELGTEGILVSEESPLLWLLFFFFAMSKIYFHGDFKRINA